MDLMLDSTEVKTAVIDYIKAQGISTTDCSIAVQLKAGRATGDNKSGGTTAIVSINKHQVTEKEVLVPAEPCEAYVETVGEEVVGSSQVEIAFEEGTNDSLFQDS